jgi:hypothetical protein
MFTYKINLEYTVNNLNNVQKIDIDGTILTKNSIKSYLLLNHNAKFIGLLKGIYKEPIVIVGYIIPNEKRQINVIKFDCFRRGNTSYSCLLNKVNDKLVGEFNDKGIKTNCFMLQNGITKIKLSENEIKNLVGSIKYINNNSFENNFDLHKN